MLRQEAPAQAVLRLVYGVRIRGTIYVNNTGSHDYSVPRLLVNPYVNPLLNGWSSKHWFRFLPVLGIGTRMFRNAHPSN